VRWEWYSLRNGRTYDLIDTPLRNTDGSLVKLEIFRDITEAKRAEKALRDSREQLRALAVRLQSVREEEAKRIARRIHDDLGHGLTAVKLDLSLLAGKLRQPADSPSRGELPAKIKQISAQVDAAIQAVRETASELRPGVLDDLGLLAAIEWEVAEFERRTGIRCEIASSAEGFDLDSERSTALYRILQEILTNVARHANASKVRVDLQADRGHAVLKVADNGRGITRRELDSHGALGILGMRERALVFGGEVSFESKPNEGTTVTVRIPIGPKREA